MKKTIAASTHSISKRTSSPSFGAACIGAAAVLAFSFALAGSADAVSRKFAAVDFGAKCDGSADDTAAIQSALDAAEDAGGGIVRIPDTGRACVVYWHLEVGSNTTVVFDGSEIRFGALPWDAGEPYASRRGFRGAVISARRPGRASHDILLVEPLVDANNLPGLNGIGTGSTGEVGRAGIGPSVRGVTVLGGVVRNVRMDQYYGGGKALTVQRGASDVWFIGTRVKNAANALSVVASQRNRLAGSDSPLADEATLEYARNVFFYDIEVDGCGALLEVLDLYDPNHADARTMGVVVSDVRAHNCGASDYNYAPALRMKVAGVSYGPEGAAFSAREDVVGLRSGARARLAFGLLPGMSNAGRPVEKLTFRPTEGRFLVGETVLGARGGARARVAGQPMKYNASDGRGVLYFDGGVNVVVENVVVMNDPGYPKVGGLFRGRVRDSLFRSIVFQGDCDALFNGEAGDVGANINYPDSFAYWRGNAFESILHRGRCDYLIDASDVGRGARYKFDDNRFRSICYRPASYGKGIMGPDRVTRRDVTVDLAAPGSSVCRSLADRLGAVHR